VSALRPILALAAATLIVAMMLLASVFSILSGDEHTIAQACDSQTGPAGGFPAGSGSWIATAYGPPWTDGNGSGVTATGIDLTAAPPALEIAVDPSIVPLRSYEHVWPNPFATRQAFYAGDTGGAITGRHVDIYDWRGRTDQDGWGVRHVNVTPAAQPGTASILAEITPNNAGSPANPAAGDTSLLVSSAVCDGLDVSASLTLTPGSEATILPDGSATAPRDAPAAVKLAIVAANQIDAKPYPEPVATHYNGELGWSWPAYDCSGSVSYVLYKAGLHGPIADVSGTLEQWGQPGPGRWITVYANSTHTWVVIAGLAFDTADYGGPNIPAGTGPRWRQNPIANLQDGFSYVVRHPPGL
jgi:3D (Asp-Asp-Asp) domain-containing protein